MKFNLDKKIRSINYVKKLIQKIDQKKSDSEDNEDKDLLI